MPWGARAIHGPIRDQWFQMQTDAGYLGFPVSDVEPTLQTGNVIGQASYFQNGSLELQSDGSVQAMPNAVEFQRSIHGGHVNCTLTLQMNSSGDWHYFGHMHNDGFAGCTATAVVSPGVQDAAGHAFALPAVRSLGGTLDGEPRNDDWDQNGNDAFIAENWPLIRSAGLKIVLETEVQVGDVLNLLWPIAAALVIIGGSSGKKWCGPYGSISRDPITGENVKSAGFVLTEPDQPCPNQPGEPLNSP